MSDELHGKILFTIFVVWLMLWPSLQQALDPERLTSRFEAGAPEFIKRVVPWMGWLQVLIFTALLLLVWLWF